MTTEAGSDVVPLGDGATLTGFNLQVDFNKIKFATTPLTSTLMFGVAVSNYKGLQGGAWGAKYSNLKLAESVGHEMAHMVWAIANPEAALKLQYYTDNWNGLSQSDVSAALMIQQATEWFAYSMQVALNTNLQALK
jgi:hypothetical protein